jgi:hypothetical protein
VVRFKNVTLAALQRMLQRHIFFRLENYLNDALDSGSINPPAIPQKAPPPTDDDSTNCNATAS